MQFPMLFSLDPMTFLITLRCTNAARLTDESKTMDASARHDSEVFPRDSTFP